MITLNDLEKTVMILLGPRSYWATLKLYEIGKRYVIFFYYCIIIILTE